MQRSHKPQRINTSLKPHEALGKSLVDQKPDTRPQGNGVATDEALGKTPDLRPQGNDFAKGAGLAIDRAPDEVQAALPTEREAGQTLGVASVNRAADAAQSTPQSISEGKGTAITTSLALGALTVAMVVLLIEFLFRRTYAKRVVASRAMRLSEPPPDYVPPVDLSLRNQVEAYPSAASSLESVKKSIETIEEVVAEMTSSRQLRSHL